MDKNSTILTEALGDYKAILEAADKNAMKKLAKEFPEKFSQLLKEEIKNKNKKESYKKIDDTQESDKDDNNSNKNSDMKKEDVKETVKVVDTVGKGKPFDSKAKKVEEDVKVTNTVGKSDPFDKKGKKIDEEREKDFMADIEAETPNQAKGETAKGEAFKTKIKNPTSGKPITNLKEEFNISELDIDSVGSALDNAGDEDDIITIDEIEAEISQMQDLGNELGGTPTPANGGGNDAYSELVEMRNKLDEMIKTMGGTNESTELQSDEMSPNEFAGLSETQEITDDEVNAVLGASSDEDIDEAHGVSYSTGSGVQGRIPSSEYLSTGENAQRRWDESNKKLGALIEENKKLTKSINESKKYKKSVSTLVEGYKSALEKYRNQLKEMAIFNTNLAHVNNLLVNESLALTQNDKIKIINGFKQVESISESQEKYKSFLTEMKGSKKAITERIESKTITTIEPSSKQKLDEVVVKTAYENNDHLNKMKKIIKYVENRRK